MISSEERLALTQDIVAQTREVLQENNATLSRDGQNMGLSALLEQAVILDVSDRMVGCDAMTDHADREGIAVVGLFPGEQVQTGPSFREPTPAQRTRITRMFEAWQPQRITADALADNLFNAARNPAVSAPVHEVGEHMAACTLSMSLPLDMEHVNRVVGLAARPPARLARISMRPLVTLNLASAEGKQVEVVGHELAHYLQKQEKPVQLFSSQKQADARALRSELEAYHVGAMIKLHELGYRSIRAVPRELVLTNWQLLVESIRASVNAKDTDPFRVTPMLWARLGSLGISKDRIIHDRLDFDGTLKALHRA